MHQDRFPLAGIVGIVANDADELDRAGAARLSAVEVRADLLLDTGLSVDAVMDVVRAARERQLRCLFTLRHADQGGRFRGSEQERVDMVERAHDAGADLVDLEWDTQAARQVLTSSIPMLLSYHDFDGMPGATELATLTTAMESTGATAIKIVPTACSVADAARMLHWVESATSQTTRIGFAMGAQGGCSRILTIAFGAPITYASFGASVAPGQVPLDVLRDVYRVHECDTDTRVFAALDAGNEQLRDWNQQLADDARNAVCVPFDSADFDDLLQQLDQLRIDRLHIPESLAGRALAFVDRRDDSIESGNRADLLTVERTGVERIITAFSCGPSLTERFLA